MGLSRVALGVYRAAMRTLSDLGERRLIERISRMTAGSRPPGVVLGIGDDAAILRLRKKEDLVTSTDAAVEGVHFRWLDRSPVAIGRRSLIANLSDLAAMGARPLGFTLALSAPGDLALKRFDGLLSGVLREAKTHGCPLVGGNLARARETSLSISVFGAVPRGRALRRDALRGGDGLFVTGRLGAAALARLRADRLGGSIRHLPLPRLEAGRRLLRLSGHGACIDLSDGLRSDLGRLLEIGNLGADLDAARLPLPPGFPRRCGEIGVDPIDLALSGGEDYELLFSLRSACATRMSSAALTRRLGIQVTRIGTVNDRPGIRGVPASRSFLHY